MFSEALDSELDPQVQGCSTEASVKVFAQHRKGRKGRIRELSSLEIFRNGKALHWFEKTWETDFVETKGVLRPDVVIANP